MKKDVHDNVATNVLEFLYFAARFILSNNSSNCYLLYFSTNIMCSFTKKLQLRPPDPQPGLRPWTPLGDFRPQTPSLLLCPPIIL